MGNPAIRVPTITIARSAAEILNGRMALEPGCLDHPYVHAHVLMLQSCAGASYCRALSAVLDETMPSERGTIVERFDRQIDQLRRGRQMQA